MTEKFPRIAWISFSRFGVSNTRSPIEVLKLLADCGAEVHFLAIRSRVGQQEPCPNMHYVLFPLRFVPIVTPILYLIALLLYLPLFILAKEPDIIITDRGTTVVGLLVKVFLSPIRFKTILDIRSTHVKKKATAREYLNELLFGTSVVLAKKKFDGITVITKSMMREICHRFDVSAELVGVWTAGVSSDLFDPKKYSRTRIRDEFDLTGKFVILYHGAMIVERGLTEVLDSIEIVKNSCPDLMLFLVGGGSDLSMLKSLVQKKGIADRVTICDRVDYRDVPKYIAVCDIGIVLLPNSPNWRHQCPLKLLEYLAMNKAVILTDLLAHREILGKSKCGIFVSEADPKEIAEAMMYAYTNKEELPKWGSHGRRIILRRYRWEKVAKDFVEYLHSVNSA